MKFLVTLNLVLLLTACANFIPFKKPQKVEVVIGPNVKIEYTGKAAGAGMMLSSSMGPMGMAIGVAIDVGIGKEIQKNAESNQISLAQVLKEQLESAELPNVSSIALEITKIEFKSARGEGDPTSLNVELQVSKNGKKGTVFSIEQSAKLATKTYQLNELKTVPGTVKMAYSDWSMKFSAYLKAVK